MGGHAQHPYSGSLLPFNIVSQKDSLKRMCEYCWLRMRIQPFFLDILKHACTNILGGDRKLNHC